MYASPFGVRHVEDSYRGSNFKNTPLARPNFFMNLKRNNVDLVYFQHVMLVAQNECKLWGSGKGLRMPHQLKGNIFMIRVSFTSQI